MTKSFFSLVSILAFTLISGPRAEAEEILRVYFIGNSLTMSTTLDRVHALFAQRGIDLQFGSQLSGGKSLIRHLNYKKEPDQKWNSWETRVPHGDTFEPDPDFYNSKHPVRFGLFDQALKDQSWDKVVFQIYGSNLTDDVNAISAFIDLTLKNGTASNFFVYSAWPRRPKTKQGDDYVIENLDYPQKWNAEYILSSDDSEITAGNVYTSRSYSEQLIRLLNKKYPDLPTPVRLIPVGEIIYVLDRKIKAGELPGLEQLAKRRPDMFPGLREGTTFADGANILYADAIHFNPLPHQSNSLGIFVSGTSLFTGLSGESPVGLSGKPYGLDDPADKALIEAVQKTIWEVFTTNPQSGIQP